MSEILFEQVLLVEDDESHALIIRRALREYATRIEHALNVEAANKLLEADFAPDLIVTDLRLPDSSGVQHVADFVSHSKEIPVLVLTSSTELSDAVESLKIGAKDFIVKNFDADFKSVFSLSLSRVHTAMRFEKERTKLNRDLALLRIALEYSEDAFLVLRCDGTVEYSNSTFRSFVELWGGESNNILKAFKSPDPKIQTIWNTLQDRLLSLEEGAVWSSEFRTSGEAEKSYELSVTAIQRESSQSKSDVKFPECVAWIKDVSEERRKERFQREILSTTTHDLKGPLGAILVSADLLKGELAAGTRPYEIALRVGSAAKGAVNLIDEFLSARRIEQGSFILKPSKQNVLGIIEEVVDEFSTIAEPKRIQLKLESSSTEIIASVDRLGLTRLMGNLISNALKFTPSGGSVLVKVERRDDEIHYIVKDSGTGMEASEVKKIFERFARLGKHSDIPGSGIGLFVVKSIVSAHGGSIDVESRVDSGTTFDVALPVDPPVNERGELLSLDFH